MSPLSSAPTANVVRSMSSTPEPKQKMSRAPGAATCRAVATPSPMATPNASVSASARPADDAEFLHGLLESLARIEARGYGLLAGLGATPLRRVETAGGGAHNPIWTRIRERLLGVPVTRAVHTEAAYGAALLARDGTQIFASRHEKLNPFPDGHAR